MNYILGGIDKLWIASVSGNSSDYFITSGKTVVLNDIVTFNEFAFDKCELSQKKVSDARGTYYQKEFNIEVADIESDAVYDLQGQNLILLFKDTNGRQFITGFEQSYSIGKIEGKSEEGETAIEFRLSQNSYMRIQPIELETDNSIILPSDYFFSIDSLFNPHDPGFGLVAGSGMMFMFWIKFDAINLHTPSVLVERPTQYRIRRTAAPGIAFETSSDNISYNTGVTSQFNMVPDVWYFVGCYCSIPYLNIYIQDEFDSGYNISSNPFTGFADVADSVFKLAKTADEVKGFGLWQGVDIPKIENYSNNLGPATYSQLNSIDPTLLTNLICFYNDFNSTTTVPDQHTNNLDLTFQSIDE